MRARKKERERSKAAGGGRGGGSPSAMKRMTFLARDVIGPARARRAASSCAQRNAASQDCTSVDPRRGAAEPLD